MATAPVARPARDHPRAVTAVLSVAGYALVAAAFLGYIPIPDIGTGTVNLLADLIAVVNTVALAALIAGYRFIRRGDVRRHRAAMLLSFSLIMLFLVLYLTKVGGGFEKSIVIEERHFLGAYVGIVRPVYLAMLVVHVLLSVLSVPVVLYAVVLGLTHTPAELAGTAHPRVGRVAVAAWTLSLSLGILTYVMLNHVYAWEALERSALLLVGLGRPSLTRVSARGPAPVSQDRDRAHRRDHVVPTARKPADGVGPNEPVAATRSAVTDDAPTDSSVTAFDRAESGPRFNS